MDTIKIDDALQNNSVMYIDVRSQEEFIEGHIPGAINIPVFNGEERVKVGTVYKQVGQYEAKELGLEIVSRKLPVLVQRIQASSESKKTVIYCWRGGMRSKSVTTVLELMGMHVWQLSGGYKAYRKYVLDKLTVHNIKPSIVVIHGLTGVGKTKLLYLLANMGAPVVDLEKLANHRGSVFGSVGLGKPTSAKNFDAELLMKLEELQNTPYIVVECESKRIGSIYLPDCLFKAMSDGIHILAHCSIEKRIERLVGDYLAGGTETIRQITDSIRALVRRIGPRQVERLLSMVEQERYHEVTKELLVKYYDPLYNYDIKRSDKYDFVVDAEDLRMAASEIYKYLQGRGGIGEYRTNAEGGTGTAESNP